MKYLTCAMGALLAVHTISARSAEPLETRAFWVAQCPHDGDKLAFLAPLVAILAPKLIGGAIDIAGNALKAAGESHTVASVASNMSNFYKVTADGDLKVVNGCLVIARGSFDRSKQMKGETAPDADDVRRMTSTNYVFEVSVEAIDSGKYFRMVPTYLKVDDFEDSTSFSSNQRSFSVAFSLTALGATQPFGSAEIKLPNIRKGVEWGSDSQILKAAASHPIAFPAVPADASAAQAKRNGELAPYLLALDILTPEKSRPVAPAPSVYLDKKLEGEATSYCDRIQRYNELVAQADQRHDDRCGYQVDLARARFETEAAIAFRNSARSNWAKAVCQYQAMDPPTCANTPNFGEAARNARYGLVVTDVTVSEVREGSKFAEYLGSALAGSKASLTSAAVAAITPRTQAEKDAKDAAARASTTGSEVADLNVQMAQQKLDEIMSQPSPNGSDVTSARIGLLKAKISSNDARRAAGLPVVYPEIE